ncbi:hypothetical protein AMELA_G00243360 [Ameiurus melas]|uniref:Uncharacterized protein n=1 Tax=Ameiurus melas TaxID=219545 RepID=A0A7J5ZWM8_AMEME|nr:hypothetical protein AMELA_G00243360 [Ameiurus melas]
MLGETLVVCRRYCSLPDFKDLLTPVGQICLLQGEESRREQKRARSTGSVVVERRGCGSAVLGTVCGEAGTGGAEM